MRFNDCTTNEGYVALQAWLGGQMTPRAPHATQLFAEDQECLYDVFLSMLVGTGMGFDDFDDNRAHHGLYAFDFLVGDVEMPSALPLSAADADGQVDEAGGGSALCHALVDTWRGERGAARSLRLRRVGRRIHAGTRRRAARRQLRVRVRPASRLRG